MDDAPFGALGRVIYGKAWETDRNGRNAFASDDPTGNDLLTAGRKFVLHGLLDGVATKFGNLGGAGGKYADGRPDQNARVRFSGRFSPRV
mgnify:CR=1 FL=1